MKDWKRSPEPPGMMGLKDTSYQVQGNWGQPEELASTEFDPASPLPNTCPQAFRTLSRNPIHAPPPSSGLSLYSMCLRVILRNISSVQDLGDMPYRNAKPILEECRIEQLITLEEASPHLLEHTEEIWKRNCLRDFIELRKKYDPSTSDTPLPKEPKSWRRLYFRTKGEIEQAKVEAAKRIKDKYDQHRAEKEAKKLVVSDRPLMAKNARSGGRRFGMIAGAGGGGGVSKGQSLINKARSGSAAQAKLTAPRNGRSAFKGLGRSKAVGAEIAPEAAGIAVREMVRSMVAPRRIQGGGSEGLAKMKEFSRPLPGSDGVEEAAKSSTSRSKQAESTQRADSDIAQSSTGLPRLKPHEVAAAAPLTPTAISSPKVSSALARSRLTSSHVGSSSSQHAESWSKKAPPQSSSPPADIARVERRKLNFFGSSKSSSSSLSAAAAGGSSSSSRPGSPLSSSTTGIEVRGMKRTHSSSSTPTASRASPTKNVASPPASSPTVSSFAPFSSAIGKSSVKVVQAKRARTQEKPDTQASPRPSPPPEKVASPSTRSALPTSVPTNGSGSTRPSPVRPQSHSFRLPASGRGVQDSRMVRASPAALSSIFAPSRPASRGGGGGNPGSR